MPFRSLTQATPPALSRLVRRARALQRISALITARLPDPLPKHCQPGNIANDTLIVYLDSPNWATKFRFHTPRLVTQLQKDPLTAHIKHIKAIVAPSLFTGHDRPQSNTMSRPEKRSLSRQSASLLRQAALSTSSPRLAAALRRLARHADDGEQDY